MMFLFGIGLLAGFASTKKGTRLGNFHAPDGIYPYLRNEQRGGSGSDAEGRGSSKLPRPFSAKSNSLEKASIGRLYETVGDDGRLTWGIREIAGLDETSSALAQHAIDNAFSRFHEVTARNFKPVDSQSNPESGLFVYELKAFPEEGAEIWKELAEGFEQSAGRQGAEYLIAAFHPETKLAELGKYGMRFSYQAPDPSGLTREAIIQVEYVDPETGKALSSGSYTAGNAPSWMRKLLDQH